MYESAKQRIVFIGSGRLATNMAKALHAAGHTIVQVYSPTLVHARQLAATLGTAYTDKVGELSTDTDCYIIAVSDSAIEQVLHTVGFGNRLVVHTSGATSINVFKGYVARFGVFYPFQTFSKEHAVSFERVPMLIEGSSPEVAEQLQMLAHSISGKVYTVDSTSRLKLHVAGVFACNFVNHLLAIADMLTQEAGLDFSLLHELVTETLEKALSVTHPVLVQTGPAIRNDDSTISKHLELLAAHPDWQTIYCRLTESIKSHA